MESLIKNFWKSYSLISTVAIAIILFYFNSCRKCPECPVIVSSHTEGKMELHTSGKGDSSLITQVPDTGKIKRSKPVNHEITESNEASEGGEFLIDTTGPNISRLQINDSICKETIDVTIENNKATGFDWKRDYLLPFSKDTIIQYVPMAVHKNTFTLGLFAGKSSGANIGYRFNGNHVTAGYDFLNKGWVAGFNFDLK